ncbi:MAG: translation elongation factor Ts, partial [Eubacteriales bacterium]|nr:translation elongation factor Ts [Eubacteriales bacterium]
VLVEVNIETDFAAKNQDFRAFVKDVAMQIAATKPDYISRVEIPEEVISKEREIFKAQAVNEGKPEKIIDKVVEGRLEKHLKEICLLDQPWIKDPDKTIGQLVNERIAAIGEKISIRRFARFEKGEGIEKRSEDFADEVMKQMCK